MRILFDQGTPVPLRRHLSSHTVSTTFELNWSQLTNSDLLARAESEYDVFVTTDKNLRYQQFALLTEFGRPETRHRDSAIRKLAKVTGPSAADREHRQYVDSR